MEGYRLPSLFMVGSYNKDLNELLEIIQAQFFLICIAWKKHSRVDEIKFYC